jgi:integrase
MLDSGGNTVEKKKLTDAVIQALCPGAKRIRCWDTEIPGYFVQLSPRGLLTLYLRYRLSGRIREFKLGVYGGITAAQGRKLARAAAGDVARGIDIQLERKEERRKLELSKRATLGAFIEEVHEPYLVSERKTGKRIVAQLRTSFGHWFTLPMSEISEWRVRRWRQDELKRGISNGSVNRPVTYLRSCLNHAYRTGVIDSHPLQHLRPLKEDRAGVVRYLSSDEEVRLRNALRARDDDLRAARIRHNEWLRQRNKPPLPVSPSEGYSNYLTPLVLLALNTGLRRGELFQLRWKDLDWQAETLTVSGKHAKSRTTRHVQLNAEALRTLNAWRRQCSGEGQVFFNPHTGAPLTDIKRAWGRVLKAAKIQKFRFHDLRHHFASALVMAGADLNTVRDLLGHSDLTMTLRYAHLSPSHCAAAVALLDNRVL